MSAATRRFYGTALFRLSERNFDELQHKAGVSPARPLNLADYEPYYGEAERLFHVHGERGEEPSEPRSSRPFPDPVVSHEPRIQALHDLLEKAGLHPFHLRLGILLDEKNAKVTPTSTCIRWDAFDGFPCLLNGKANAQVVCVDPALAAYPNLTLMTHAYVTRLQTDASGPTVTGVHVEQASVPERYTADIVVVACGALSSALSAIAFRKRDASEWACKWLRSGRPQLHAASPVNPDGAGAGTQRNRAPEDTRHQRLLL